MHFYTTTIYIKTTHGASGVRIVAYYDTAVRPLKRDEVILRCYSRTIQTQATLCGCERVIGTKIEHQLEDGEWELLLDTTTMTDMEKSAVMESVSAPIH